METICEIFIILSQTEGNTLLFASPETSLSESLSDINRAYLQPRPSNQPILLSLNNEKN
jgi:hypothetical protein